MKYHTFLPQFHPQILALTKHSTIRAKRKVEVGERFALRHWTGKPYRSPMGWLGSAVCCGVYRIAIQHGAVLSEDGVYPVQNWRFAKMEGFSSYREFLDHFHKHHGPIFSGVLTIWDPASFVPGEWKA